jgi:methanogenic corrinoid protein MtbC1
MEDGPNSFRLVPVPSSDRSVESLASQALNLLAKRRSSGSKVLSEQHLGVLRDAVLHSDPLARHTAVSEMRSAGISPEDLFDHYIPEIARRLGQEWLEDSLGFADVTIGCSRLQSLLRDLSHEADEAWQAKRTSGVVLIVFGDNYHTLGAMVFAAQLRRLGVSTRVLMGVTEDTALAELEQDRYDAVLISASEGESLVKLGKFVEKVRKQTKRNTPIVIGGPVMGMSVDVKALTGADVATSDIIEAIRECRLKTFQADCQDKKRMS